MRRIDDAAAGALTRELDSEEILVALSPSELEGIRGAVRETLNELGDWEFELRMGFTRAEIRALQAALWEL